jgi:o-succinylbenzoate---CoA ligase
MTMLLHGVQPDWLDSAVQSFPPRVALSFHGQEWTFQRLRRAVNGTSTVLRQHDIGSGRIGVLAANRPGAIFALHASRRSGIEIVMLNWRQTADEIAWQVADAGISLLLTDEERLELARNACADRATAVVPLETLEAASDRADDAPAQPIDPSRLAVILYTSGTGGRPKGAKMTYGNLWSSAVASALFLGHQPDDVWLGVLPLFHIGGLSIVIRGVIGGNQVVLHERFDPDRTNAAIDSGATRVSLVPVMLQRVLERRGDSPFPATLRTVLLGGSAAPIGLVEEAIRRGVPVAPTYGLTEAASQVTTLPPADAQRKPGSSGLPLPGTQIRIASDDGLAGAGENGQIEIKGATVFGGYLGAVNARTGWTADGWFQTGDVGYIDDEGYLYVVDRRDDLIVSGGENVYPAEVERALLEHPGVVDAGVFAIPDGTWGARPVAAVVWRGDAENAEQCLLDHCRKRLAPFKVPARIDVLGELPRSPSGKLLRRKLRERLRGAVPRNGA